MDFPRTPHKRRGERLPTIDEAHDLAREFIGYLTGKSGLALDTLMEEGAVEGARVAKEERMGRGVIAASVSNSLTSGELKALDLAADGLNHDAAAEKLGISKETYKSQLATGRGRLGAKNSPHAVRLAMRKGLID